MRKLNVFKVSYHELKITKSEKKGEADQESVVGAEKNVLVAAPLQDDIPALLPAFHGGKGRYRVSSIVNVASDVHVPDAGKESVSARDYNGKDRRN